MPVVTCSLTECIHNEQGKCEARSVYISAIEDGWPRCMDAIWLEDLLPSDPKLARASQAMHGRARWKGVANAG